MKDQWLIHHGVKGMKWGVRHDPITFGRGRRGNNIYKKQQTNQKKGLTSKQKKIIGAVAVGTALAAVGTVGVKSIKSNPKTFNLIKNSIQERHRLNNNLKNPIRFNSYRTGDGIRNLYPSNTEGLTADGTIMTYKDWLKKNGYKV